MKISILHYIVASLTMTGLEAFCGLAKVSRKTSIKTIARLVEPVARGETDERVHYRTFTKIHRGSAAP